MRALLELQPAAAVRASVANAVSLKFEGIGSSLGDGSPEQQ
jgi:hypothetical protein